MHEMDLEKVLEWRNKDAIRKNMYSDGIICPEEHSDWYKRVQGNPEVKCHVLEHAGRLIGYASVSKIDVKNGTCYWAFYIGENTVPPGSGAVLEWLYLEYVFEELGVRKLCCEVFAFNSSVVKLHKKFGFLEEGIYRKHILKNGVYEDVVILALFREEWPGIKEKMEKVCFRGK